MAKFPSASSAKPDSNSAGAMDSAQQSSQNPTLPIYNQEKSKSEDYSNLNDAMQSTLASIIKKMSQNNIEPLNKITQSEIKINKELKSTNKKLDTLSKTLNKLEKSIDSIALLGRVNKLSNSTALYNKPINPNINRIPIFNNNHVSGLASLFMGNVNYRQNNQNNNEFYNNRNQNFQSGASSFYSNQQNYFDSDKSNSTGSQTGVEQPKPVSANSQSWTDTILEGLGLKEAWGIGKNGISKTLGAVGRIGALAAPYSPPIALGAATLYGGTTGAQEQVKLFQKDKSLADAMDPRVGGMVDEFGMSAAAVAANDERDKSFDKDKSKTENKIVDTLNKFKKETEEKNKENADKQLKDAAIKSTIFGEKPIPNLNISNNIPNSNLLMPSTRQTPLGSVDTPDGFRFNNVPGVSQNPRPQNNPLPQNNNPTGNVDIKNNSEPGPMIGGNSTGTGGLANPNQLGKFDNVPNREGQLPNQPSSLDVDKNNHISPDNLYSNLVGKFSNSPLNGYVPPDGEKFGIKTGSPQEWARFGVAVAKQESGFNTKSTNLNDPGGSFGLFQFNQHQEGIHGNAYDPEASAKAFVDYTSRVVPKGGIAEMGNTSRGHQGLFGSIKRPEETIQQLSYANKVGDRVDKAGYTDTKIKVVKDNNDSNKDLNSSLLSSDKMLPDKINNSAKMSKVSIKNTDLDTSLLSQSDISTKFTKAAGDNPVVTPLNPTTLNNPDPRGINQFTGDSNIMNNTSTNIPNGPITSDFTLSDTVKAPADNLNDPVQTNQNNNQNNPPPNIINNNTINTPKQNDTSKAIDAIKPKPAGAPGDLADMLHKHWNSPVTENDSEAYNMPFVY